MTSSHYGVAMETASDVTEVLVMVGLYELIERAV